MKNALIALGVVILIGAAFWGGTMYAGATTDDTAAAGFQRGAGAPDGMTGGPMGDLTEDQIAEMEGMTQEERAAFMEEQGIDLPTDGAMTGGPGGTRGGTLEGEVIDATSEMLTLSMDSGSQTVYLDEETVVAYAEGASDLAAGSQVIVISESAADNVNMASVVVVE